MELTKKTTVLFSPELHARLTEFAAKRGVSLGELVREACVHTYGLVDTDARANAVASLGALRLPVSDPVIMKKESMPHPDALLP